MTVPDSAAPVLELRDIVFRRDGRTILHGIDLTVRAGEHWALLGPNGAGKSTILGFCGAQTFPTSGTVDVLGRRLGRVELALLRRDIGHVNPRHPIRTAHSVQDIVLTGITGTVERPMRWEPSAAEIARADELIALVGLTAQRDGLWQHLSQGERGRSLIARALIAEPRLLLLDEPTTGLDVAAREQLLETIDDLARDVPEVASVLVTHHLEELPESTTHALVISHGATVASGAARGTVTTDVISRAFEHPITVGHEGGRWSARAERARHAAGS
jgi:iron complex transport system ATP-binding protein